MWTAVRQKVHCSRKRVQVICLHICKRLILVTVISSLLTYCILCFLTERGERCIQVPWNRQQNCNLPDLCKLQCHDDGDLLFLLLFFSFFFFFFSSSSFLLFLFFFFFFFSSSSSFLLLHLLLFFFFFFFFFFFLFFFFFSSSSFLPSSFSSPLLSPQFCQYHVTSPDQICHLQFGDLFHYSLHEIFHIFDPFVVISTFLFLISFSVEDVSRFSFLDFVIKCNSVFFYWYLLFQLSDVEAGGATVFTKIGLRLAPRKVRQFSFPYLLLCKYLLGLFFLSLSW